MAPYINDVLTDAQVYNVLYFNKIELIEDLLKKSSYIPYIVKNLQYISNEELWKKVTYNKNFLENISIKRDKKYIEKILGNPYENSILQFMVEYNINFNNIKNTIKKLDNSELDDKKKFFILKLIKDVINLKDVEKEPWWKIGLI